MQFFLVSTRFYFRLSLLFLLGSVFLFIMAGSISFSGIHQQALPRGIKIFMLNYSFLGDCIFAFILPVFLILVMKQKQKGWQMLSAAFLTFFLIQCIENIAFAENPAFRFEAWQNIFAHTGYVKNHVVSCNTAMLLTTAAVLAKYSRSRLVQFLLIVAVLFMALCRVYLLQEQMWNVLIAVPVSFAAFSITEIWEKRRRAAVSNHQNLSLRNQGR
jgi:hypothetical protein